MPNDYTPYSKPRYCRYALVVIDEEAECIRYYVPCSVSVEPEHEESTSVEPQVGDKIRVKSPVKPGPNNFCGREYIIERIDRVTTPSKVAYYMQADVHIIHYRDEFIVLERTYKPYYLPRTKIKHLFLRDYFENGYQPYAAYRPYAFQRQY